ncbi:recombinase family protein [Flavobacterium sp.]|uniref:recombinase family protein n=1 Tax=Flavobacterium sp. TaxID=239 RepID=UPI004034D546
MKRLAIYARVSTSGGKQDYQRQVDDLNQVIMYQGHNTSHVLIFAEEISGYKKNEDRPELQRMLKAIEKGEIESIYVTEISRLGRNPSDTRKTIDLLSDLGIPIYIQSLGRATLDKDGKRDGIVNIILQVLLEFANAESEQMKQRSKSGLLKAARDGKAGGGLMRAYGYTKAEDKMLVIDEEEAVVVKEIYSMYVGGLGSKAISSILQQRDVPTKYNKIFGEKVINNAIPKPANAVKWSDVVVLNIITNSIYKGERQFKGETIPCPAIVTTETWDEAQRIRLTKTHRNYLTTYTYLFKDIIKCGCCGRNYFAKYKPVPKGDKVYVCSSKLYKGGSCGNKGVNISLLESAVYDQLLNSDAVLKYLTDTKDIKKTLETEIAQMEAGLKVEKPLVAEKESEKSRLLDVYLAGSISKEIFTAKNDVLLSAIENIQKRVVTLEKKIAELKKSLKKQNSNGTTKAMLLNAKDNRQQLEILFKQIVHKVIINDLSVNKIMAVVYLQVNGVVLLTPLKIVLDKFSIRKTYKYLPIHKMENEPVFKDGVLLVEKEDILNEVEGGFYVEDWNLIDNERLLYVS